MPAQMDINAEVPEKTGVPGADNFGYGEATDLYNP